MQSDTSYWTIRQIDDMWYNWCYFCKLHRYNTNLWCKSHISRQWNCSALACRLCFKYIFIIDLNMASMDWAGAPAVRDQKHSRFGIRPALSSRYDGYLLQNLFNFLHFKPIRDLIVWQQNGAKFESMLPPIELPNHSKSTNNGFMSCRDCAQWSLLTSLFC